MPLWYFSTSFVKTNRPWNYSLLQRWCFNGMRSNNKLSREKCCVVNEIIVKNELTFCLDRFQERYRNSLRNVYVINNSSHD